MDGLVQYQFSHSIISALTFIFVAILVILKVWEVATHPRVEIKPPEYWNAKFAFLSETHDSQMREIKHLREGFDEMRMRFHELHDSNLRDHETLMGKYIKGQEHEQTEQ